MINRTGKHCTDNICKLNFQTRLVFAVMSCKLPDQENQCFVSEVSFQHSLGQSVPERQTVPDFVAARDDESSCGDSWKCRKWKLTVRSPSLAYQHSAFVG